VGGARGTHGRKLYKVLERTPEDYSEDGGVDGRVVSKWFLRRLAGKVWNGFTYLRIGTGVRLL
jgi:hypothetical protein